MSQAETVQSRVSQAKQPRVIKFYRLADMQGTPFSNEKTLCLLNESGVVSSSRLRDADFVVAPRSRLLLKSRAFMTQKPLLVWTNEPGDEPKKSVVSSAAGLGRITRVMNVFSGDVFWNNRHFLGSYHFDTSNNLGIDLSAPVSPITLDEYQSRQSFVSAVFTHSSERSRTYKLSSGHGSLLGARCAVVEAFRKQSATIVAGRGWPPGVSIEDSGYRGNEDADLPWWTRKLEILKKAKINIAIENTAAPWYCTEKIWHSIVSKALPVYRSEGTRIYETFPRESFIDTSDYECDGSMVDAVVALADDEVVTRINTCIDVYNREREKRISEIPHSYGDCISRVLERIRTIVPTSI